MKKVPKYRKQKRNGKPDLAFVEIGGQKIYLGEFETPESVRAYHSIMAEYDATKIVSSSTSSELTIVELFAMFTDHAEKYYRKTDGTLTSENASFKQAMSKVTDLYVELPVNSFSPKKLKAIRQIMIDKRLSRTYINATTRRIKQIFKWGLENELVKPETLTALRAMAGLRRGRSDAVEPDPVKPVSQADIIAVKTFVSRQVWSMIQLQLHTAARPGEIVQMRAIDIDMSNEVWVYVPADHKTAYHGHSRMIYIGPKAKDIVRRFLTDRPIDGYFFDPREAYRELMAAKATKARRPGQKPNIRKTDRVIGERYTTDSYRRAIQRACDQAKVPRWHPNQLRHNAGTNIRREFGLEAAQVMLGHAEIDTTQIYAEVNQGKAVLIASKIG